MHKHIAVFSKEGLDISRYRLKLYCFNCEKTYTTNLKKQPGLPFACKFCGSTRLRKLEEWRILE